MESLALNSTILTPRGFRSRARGPREGVSVAPRPLWGSDHVAALRDAPFVRVVEQGVDRDTVVSVVALALAGVPVTGQGLPQPVRELLDPHLLEIADQIGPDTASDTGERELASLALRRRAWQVAGYRPSTPVPPVVVALLPEGEHSAYLMQDLAAQVTPGLTVTTRTLAADDDAEQVVREERERGAVYVTRLDAGLRYGPHHLADLVHALSHSGARVALSPRRFVPWQGAWLEDGAGAVESAAERGLPGGSLWYAVDGADEPVAGSDGYAVHGANAVPVHDQESGSADLAPLRMHHGMPRLLDWLGEHAAGADAPGVDAPGADAPGADAPGADAASAEQPSGAVDAETLVGASYFARGSGGPDRARSSVTASES